MMYNMCLCFQFQFFGLYNLGCPHGQNFKSQVTLLLSQEKLSYVYYSSLQGESKLHKSKLISVFHHLHSLSPEQLCALAHQGLPVKEVVPSC